MEDETINTDDGMRADAIADKIDAELAEAAPQDAPAEQAGGNSEAAKPITEEQPKPNAEGKVEPSGAIEPPTSWPNDDKEAFKSLPTWAQERIVTRESEREAHFSQRSQSIANREREISQIERTASDAHAAHISALEQLNQLANQLLPAKFSDIRSEADYLKLKVSDPARASEFEAFQSMLQRSKGDQAQLQQANLQKHLDNEWNTLSSKFPEFKDQAKATAILDGVRKTAVEYYGFSPQEVTTIADHRYVPVLRDAMAWRQYQANLKTAEAKKAAPQLQKVVRQASPGTSSFSDETRAKTLNRAKKSSDMHQAAALIASTF